MFRGLVHFHAYPTFSKQAKKFDAGQREAKSIYRKLVVACPVLLVVGLSLGIRAAFAEENATVLLRFLVIAITTVAVEVVGLGAIFFAAIVGKLNDRIKPPLPDGTRRRSMIVYLFVVPVICIVSLLGFCFLFVVFMQPHPLHFMMTMFQ